MRGGEGRGGLLTNREFDKLYSLYCPLPFHHFVLKVFECGGGGRGGEGGGLLTNREFDKLYSLYCLLPFHHFVLKVFECGGGGVLGGGGGGGCLPIESLISSLLLSLFSSTSVK